MNVELHVLGAAIKNRETFYIAQKYLNTKHMSREFSILFGMVGEYYRRDEAIRSVDPAVLAGQLAAEQKNPKHQKMYEDMIAAAVSADVSEQNINDLIIAAKKKEVGERLAVSLANRDGKEGALIEEYKELQNLTSIHQLEQDDELVVIDSSTINELLTRVVSKEGAFQLYPKALNDRLDGRLNTGHHVTIFAPPEVGKTALNCTFAAGFCMQGRKGVYFLNEDKEDDVFFRLVSCITGLTWAEIQASPAKAVELAKERGIDNVTLVGMYPGNLNIVEATLDKYGAEWSILDQLINMNVKGDGPTQIVEKAAKSYREVIKRTNTLGISTCQAGDSAEGKAVLTMGDVYMSNTGIPAACDVLIGVGATADMLMTGERVATFCKNKMTGDHSSVPLFLNAPISRYMSR